MSHFCKLPDELLMIICEHLQDSPTSLKALALARISPGSMGCAQETLQKQIDVMSGDRSVVHSVFAHVLASASSGTSIPPYIIGDAHADTVIQHASSYTCIRLRLSDGNGVSAPVNDPRLLREYLRLVSKLEPQGTHGTDFWKNKFKHGKIDGLLHFLLLVARKIKTLDMQGSLEWTSGLDTQGLFTELNNLKLKDLDASIIPIGCRKLFRQPSLRTLEISETKLLAETIRNLGVGPPKSWQLSITDLRLVDCYVTPCTLGKLVQGCRTLTSFQYTIGKSYWPLNPTTKSFDLAELLYQLRSNHKETLQFLEIRATDFQVNNVCHFAEEVKQLQTLRTLSLDYGFLHFNHAFGIPYWNSDRFCELRRDESKNFFTDFSRTIPSPVALLISLPSSLQRLEIHQGIKIHMTSAILELMHHMNTSGCLPNLVTIKATFKSRPSRTDIERQSYIDLFGSLQERSCIDTLRDTAATVRKKPDVLHVELEDLRTLLPDPYFWQM